MPITNISKRLSISALAVLGLSMGAMVTPVHAQPGYDSTSGGGGEITVRAPRPVEHRGFLGRPNLVTESVAVYYGDLDLNAAWGVRALRARVVDAAYRVCGDLDNQPQLMSEERIDCVRPAVNQAMYDAPIPRWLRASYSYDSSLY